MKSFEVTPQILKGLYDLAEEQGVKFDEEQAKTSSPLFSMILKGLIGRDIFDNPTYFKVYNLHDPIFNEALRLINSPDYDALLSAPR